MLHILISTLFSGRAVAPETEAAYLALAALATAALELPVGDAQYGGCGCYPKPSWIGFSSEVYAHGADTEIHIGFRVGVQNGSRKHKSPKSERKQLGTRF